MNRLLTAILLLAWVITASAQTLDFGSNMADSGDTMAFGGELPEGMVRINPYRGGRTADKIKSTKPVDVDEVFGDGELFEQARTINNGVAECVCTTTASPFTLASIQLGKAPVSACEAQEGMSYKANRKQVATLLRCGVRVTQKGYNPDPKIGGSVDLSDVNRQISAKASKDELNRQIRRLEGQISRVKSTPSGGGNSWPAGTVSPKQYFKPTTKEYKEPLDWR